MRVVRTLQKIVNAAEFISWYLDTVNNSSGFIAPSVALVRWEQGNLATKKANIEKRCRKFVERGTKLDTGPVSVPSKEIKWTFRYIFDDKTNPWAYWNQLSKLCYNSDWYGARMWKAVPVSKVNKRYKSKSVIRKEFEHFPGTPSIPVMNTMNKLFV